MNKSVAVIGGSGFLGKHILRSLSKHNYTKLVCVDLVDPSIPGVEFLKGNILESDSLSSLRSANIIINCTGQVTAPITKCLEQNSKGILSILNALDPHAHFIQISSVGVYGEVEEASESTQVNPQTAYSTAKAVAEFLITSQCKAKHSILRLSNLYGPEQPKGLMAYLKRSLQTDKILEFQHSGNMLRSFLHVEDCVEIIVALINKQPLGSEIYNIAGSEPVSVTSLVKLVETEKKINYKVNWGTEPAWENVKRIRTEKINNLLNIKFKHSVPEYIKAQF